MTFIKPWILYLLPLSVLPLLWHLIWRRQRRRMPIPSLFFLDKLYKARTRFIFLTDWLELAAEISLLLFMILAFAHTVSSIALAKPARLAVFLYNSPSVFKSPTAEQMIIKYKKI